MKNLNLFVLFLLSIMLFTSCDQLEDILGIGTNETTEKLKYYFEENFVDNLDAIYCSNEHIILFGFEEVPVSSELTREERVVYIGRVENNTIVEEDAIAMVVDSTNYPVWIAAKDFNMILSKVDESHFDCAVYSSQTDQWVEYDNLVCDLPNEENGISTRALASNGYSEFGLDDIFSIANIGSSMKNGLGSALKGDNLGVLETNLDVLNEFNPNDELSLGIGMAFSGSLGGALLNMGGYFAKKLDDFVVEQLGRVRLSIEDIQYIDATTSKIEYSINGLNKNGLMHSEIGLEVYNSEAMFYLDYITSENCSGYRFIKLPPGKYTVELYVKSTKYELVEYRVMHTFQVFDLKIEKCEIEENPLYANGAVNFKLNIFLDGDEAGFKDVQQFGYYIKYANAIDYKEVKNLSSIFESTPLTYELSIPRDGFSNETINYTTFEAKPSIDYYIGVYVVLKNGNIVHFDEEIIEELVYCKKPEIQFTSAHAKSTEVIETYDDGDVRYKTYYTFDCNINGCFWIDYIQYTISQSNVNNYWDPDYPKNDGDYTFNGWAEYTNSAVYNSYFTIYLTNGGTLSSENGLQLSCGGGSGSMSVTGGNTRSLSKSFNTINTNSSINGQLK